MRFVNPLISVFNVNFTQSPKFFWNRVSITGTNIKIWVYAFLVESSWTPNLSGMVRRYYSQHTSALKENDKPQNYVWILLKSTTEGMSIWIPVSQQTADGLCLESFTSSGARPGQYSSVIILCIWLKRTLSACSHITLWLLFCFGIYRPVGYCKAWFLSQHQHSQLVSQSLHEWNLIYCESCVQKQGSKSCFQPLREDGNSYMRGTQRYCNSTTDTFIRIKSLKNIRKITC